MGCVLFIWSLRRGRGRCVFFKGSLFLRHHELGVASSQSTESEGSELQKLKAEHLNVYI